MVDVTVKEISRLIDWLKEKGHTPEEIEDCIDHISQEHGDKVDKKEA